MTDYMYGIFTIANVFMALCIAYFSYKFLSKTKSHHERRPWDFLFVSSVLFLTFEILSLIFYFGVGLDMIIISKVFEFLYSGFVLLAFVSQHDLISKSHLILLSRKDDKVSDEAAADLDKQKTKKRK